MSLEFTLVRRAISLAVIDGPDADDNPDILQAQGSVLFEPVIKKGDSIQVQTRGGSETYALAPIECPINDGIISHRGQDGVKLPAGGEAANPSLIRWKATFSRMQAGGKSFTLAPVIFDAIPGGEIDLTMVAPVAGAPEGVVRGPRGTSLESIIVDGSELVFTAVDDAGSFEIARIPLDDMVRAEADAAAAAAVDNVGATLAATVDAANAARDDAKGHADRAEEASGTVAGEVYDQLSGLVVQAEGAASTATGAAGDASQSKDAAATSETNAAQSENDAAGYADLAEQYKTAAGVHESNAAQSETNAAQSETNAAASEQAAATSESNAAISETNADASATAAATSATEAKDHADRAEQMADPTGLRNEVMQQLADLVDGAPEDLDTIREVAEYAQANRDIADQLNAAIGSKADKTHTHSQRDITGLSTALSGKANSSHKHTTADITDFATEMGKKANTSHTHTRAQILGLGTALDAKANATHTHTSSQVDGLDAALARLSSIRAWFRGEGPPPASIPGAQVGDWWLDETAMELHEITGV